jgi:hypothetical protein
MKRPKQKRDTSTSREIYRRELMVGWLRMQRPDVFEACRQEAFKKFPSPAKTKQLAKLPERLKNLK